MAEILKDLEKILEERKKSSSSDSYVASLYEKGIDQILKKVAEESSEVIMATKDKEDDKIIFEVADLLFHIMILLRYKNITFSDIEKELRRRYGISGIVEKNNRKN